MFINSENIWGSRGETDLLLFLLTGISFDPSMGPGCVHFTDSGAFYSHFPEHMWLLLRACLGFSDTWPRTPTRITQHLCKPDSVRELTSGADPWPVRDGSLWAPLVSPECTILRCIPHGSQMVTERSGPSFPQPGPNLIVNFLWIVSPSFSVSPLSNPLVPFPEVTSQTTCIQALVSGSTFWNESWLRQALRKMISDSGIRIFYAQLAKNSDTGLRP